MTPPESSSLPPTALAAHDASCSRADGGDMVQVLGASVAFEPTSLNLIFGNKESGKNLLLRMLGLMEKPDRGEIVVFGKPTRDWPDAERTEVRSRHFGFVFESPFLLPSFNVVENIAMPLFKLTGATPESAREQTSRVLTFTGLQQCAEASVETLPPWAQLRVSLARALITSPMALFIENLDSILRDDELVHFLELLAAVRRDFGCCIIATAACRDLAAFGGRALELSEGRIVRDWIPGGLLS
jgi:predicted ABC-type transport system involved in lysophospholipase L1 biosynthesis ATPase subunit